MKTCVYLFKLKRPDEEPELKVGMTSNLVQRIYRLRLSGREDFSVLGIIPCRKAAQAFKLEAEIIEHWTPMQSRGREFFPFHQELVDNFLSFDGAVKC